MDDVDNTAREPNPDFDAVRHLNQFGTPNSPLMEIACTLERKDQVIQFFKDSDIQIWPDNINPLFAPDIAPGDTSLTAVKKHHGHSIRVLNACWKAGHYIQNQDTAAYYMRILTQVVRSSDTLYTWPSKVTGINIDARGVQNLRDNPKISFDYVQGYEAPVVSNDRNKTIVVRSFATGGAPPQAKQ